MTRRFVLHVKLDRCAGCNELLNEVHMLIYVPGVGWSAYCEKCRFKTIHDAVAFGLGWDR